MIRIGKMTDYGIVLLTYFSREAQNGANLPTFTARDLSELSAIPLPTVSKLLKTLCRGEILVSIRGIHGGYQLARQPSEVSVAQVIRAIEGPIALTECSQQEVSSACELEGDCPVSGNWQIISKTVSGALEQLSLEHMKNPMPKRRPKTASTSTHPKKQSDGAHI